MISCKNLVKEFKSVQALKDVNINIEGNGCFGFLGGNGAGKTTTIRILTGLAKPTNGEVKVLGYDIVNDKEKILKSISYLPQHPAFYDYMTGEEWMHFVGELYGFDKSVIKDRTEELLKKCGIWDARNRQIGGYSGGMKQRLGIAQSLVNKPKLLFLDEPVSALDPIGRHEVLTLILELKKEMAIFMSSHILEDVEKIADQIIIIDKGEVILSSTIDELKASYTQPIISFEILSPIGNLSNILQAQDWIVSIQEVSNHYKVTVKNIDIAKIHLPKMLHNAGAIITKYEIESSSLEDIFLRLVK
jgi:ABC-2 type transport system ATP-binding protein